MVAINRRSRMYLNSTRVNTHPKLGKYFGGRGLFLKADKMEPASDRNA